MLLSSKTSRFSSLVSKADAARDRLDWKTAAQLYRESLAIESDHHAIWIQLGHAIKESGDIGGAESAYRRAIEIKPEDSDAHLQLGHALKLGGRADQALEAYLKSLELDPGNKHARHELANLGLVRRSVSQLLTPKRGAKGKPGAVRQLAFDVSDLIHYFRGARTPTGIQRVQINVVTSILTEERSDIDVTIVCFTESIDFWVEVSPESFLRVCRLALWAGDTKDPIWRKAVDDLHADLSTSDPVRFARGACLLNLGTSWWLQNYFLMVRYAKERFGIAYVPYVHDCIPVVAPEHCVKELTQDFITWLLGVFLHADAFLVNSKATSADLMKVSKVLGHDIAPPKPIYLDGGSAQWESAEEFTATADEAPILADNHLAGQPFVLFVSTIESRKNHLLAFDAWLKLIKKRGLANTPRLVCVGNRGWMVEAAMARLASSDLLKKKVTMLSKISDDELASLYRNCAFTIYPSSYEGWGLPVTESFSHGKACLAANISSLPEAGGVLADYFDIDSERDFLTKLERLIDDEAYRSGREELIRTSFKPRSWTEIAAEIVDAALEQSTRVVEREKSLDRVTEAHWVCEAPAGVYHTFSRNTETRIWKNMSAGETFRMGLGWNFCDDWGCWMKGDTADIAFKIPADSIVCDGRYLIYLALQGLPANTEAANFRIDLVGEEECGIQARILPSQWLYKKLEAPARLIRNGVVRLRLESDARVALSATTDGVDRRTATLGVAGFYYCADSDANARLRFVEALQLSDLGSLKGRLPYWPMVETSAYGARLPVASPLRSAEP
ncbi:MAG TPA: glycosyltransferase [Roseiarcus sp.]